MGLDTEILVSLLKPALHESTHGPIGCDVFARGRQCYDSSLYLIFAQLTAALQLVQFVLAPGSLPLLGGVSTLRLRSRRRVHVRLSSLHCCDSSWIPRRRRFAHLRHHPSG